MKNVKTRTLVFVLLVVLIVLSGYLTYAKSVNAEQGVCIINNDSISNCGDVQNSKYGSFLGIKVCHWGLVVFSLLLVIYIVANTKNRFRKNAHELFVLFSFIGALVAIYFIYVQFFVLKSLCSTCLIIDAATVLVFVLAYLETRKG